MPSSFLHRQHGHSRGDRSCHTHSYTPHYGNDVPFEVPESWVWCKLIDVCHIFGRIGFRGYTKDDFVSNDGAITLSPSNIIDGQMNYDNCSYISWEKYEESPEIQIANGDILLVKTGSSFGKCAYVCNLPQKATINPQFVVLKYILCNPVFLTYMLQSGYARRNYDEFVLGTAIPTFTQAALGNMYIPLPSKQEQQRIVNAIGQWFKFIDDLEKEQNGLQRLFQLTKSKILDLAIHGKLVPQDPDDEPAIELLKRINPSFVPCDNGHSGKMPEGWIYCNLKDVANIQDNKRCPIKTEERNKRSKGKSILYPYYGATGIAGYIDDFLLDGKYILLGEDGAPFLDKYAKKAYEAKGKIWVNNHVHILEPQINFSYLLHYLNTVDYSYYVKGTTRLKLTQSDMSSIKVLLPPLSEQQRIATKIEEIFAVLDEIQKSIED